MAQRIFNHNENTLRELMPGDLVEIERKGYSHWAVFVGNQYSIQCVVHFGKGSKSIKTKIYLEDFWKVTKDSKAYKRNAWDDEMKARNSDEIVKKALSKVGKEFTYDPFEWNCEHFASKCCYGVAKSKQATLLKAVLIILTAISAYKVYKYLTKK